MNLRRFQYIILAALALLALACGGKNEQTHEHTAAHDQKTWKEMDVFHLVMAETFHPFKDSSNLDPVKIRAAELLAAADEWAAASLPEKVDNDEVRSKLEKLKSEATILAETVKVADDNEIAEHLTQLHDTFHELQEAWYGGH